MADKLTREQALAVENRGGELLVSAAAGSGKTKVLVDRLMGYLTDPKDPANLDDFVIITYTKAAASELRGKIAAKLSERIAQEPENRHLQKQMQRLVLTKISTVHGFCSDLLREYAYRLDIAGDFRVADENECLELRENILSEILEQAYENAGEDPDFRTLVDTQGLGRDDRLVPQIIEQVFDSARCHLDPADWLEKCGNAADMTGVTDASETKWGRYLMEDLHEYLKSQADVMKVCAEEAEACPGLNKAAANLWDTVHQIEALENLQTWDEIAKRPTIDYGRLVFPRNKPDPELEERIKALRDACKKGISKKLSNFADDSAQVLSDMNQTAAGVRALIKLVGRFEEAYSSAKRSRRILDFGDLEHKTLDLLLGKSRSGPTAAALEIGRRYREIMVDEYQDSNGVQDAIFGALTRERGKCFLVGDVKQSIYRFRLADPEIFLRKYHAYGSVEEAAPRKGRKVLLSHNFRSGGEIIEGVNDVFRTCMCPEVGGLYYGDGEALREGIPHAPLPEPGIELYALETGENGYQEEASFVADKIQQMLREGTRIRKDGGWKPVAPEDIVILLRSPGSAGGLFLRELENRGIPCTTGGGTDLLETEEIGTLRAFLEVILNPRQDIPLISTLASPIFGFSADELAALRSGRKKGSVYDALLACETPKAKAFLDLLDTLRQEARHNTLTGLLQRCLTLTRLDSVYAAMAGGETKEANLQAFYQLAADFEKGSLRDISQFLDYLTSLEERGLTTDGGAGSGCVTIMSIHKSKGLEFPVVFLSNLSRKFNQESLRAQILSDKELGLGLSVADSVNRIRYPSIAKSAIAVKMAKESVSEELRVLYVAMTRARDRLIMTYASPNLENRLKSIVLRQSADGGKLLCREANCLGDWVLLAATRHTEAGELHALGGKPEETHSYAYPWKIRVAQGLESARKTEERPQEQAGGIPAGTLDALKSALAFRYPYAAATQAPSKQTATGRKGRVKDEEAAQDTREPKHPTRLWRDPAFLSSQTRGKDYGTAIHRALQYIRYEACVSETAVSREIARLVEEGYLPEEQGNLVNCGKLSRFFATDLGRKLRTGTPYLREFKFSILDDGSHYGENLEGEQVLLQGVVDCALLEEDGITILDFKTDYVTDSTIHAVTDRYRPQIEVYGEALSRIYEQPIKGKYLYFFHLEQFMAIE